MSLSKTIQDAINKQINLELASAYAYLSMAAFFEGRALNGFGKWMRMQYAEENGHAMKFYDYLLDRGGRVELQTLAAPPQDFTTPLAAFEQSLAHEQKVTKSIHRIYELAHEEKDYATVSLLKWFVDEQVEEEKTVSDVVDRLKIAGDNPNALLLLDSMAGQRTTVE
jgi:ferritin